MFQISQLVEEVSRLRENLQRLQETSAQTTARLEEELEARRQHISRLESKLDRQRDYDELKREISVLRSVDLSQIPTGEPGKSLEHLLMERSKALQQAETLKPPSTPDALGKFSCLECKRKFNIASENQVCEKLRLAFERHTFHQTSFSGARSKGD